MEEEIALVNSRLLYLISDPHTIIHTKIIGQFLYLALIERVFGLDSRQLTDQGRTGRRDFPRLLSTINWNLLSQLIPRATNSLERKIILHHWRLRLSLKASFANSITDFLTLILLAQSINYKMVEGPSSSFESTNRLRLEAQLTSWSIGLINNYVGNWIVILLSDRREEENSIDRRWSTWTLQSAPNSQRINIEFHKNENLMLHEGWNYSIECQLGYYSIVMCVPCCCHSDICCWLTGQRRRRRRCPSAKSAGQSTVLSSSIWSSIMLCSPKRRSVEPPSDRPNQVFRSAWSPLLTCFGRQTVIFGGRKISQIVIWSGLVLMTNFNFYPIAYFEYLSLFRVVNSFHIPLQHFFLPIATPIIQKLAKPTSSQLTKLLVLLSLRLDPI